MKWYYESDGDNYNKAHYLCAENLNGKALKDTFLRLDFPNKKGALKILKQLNEEEVMAQINFRNKFINDSIILLNNVKDKLNDWEKDFLENITNLRDTGCELSRKQYNTLTDLCNKYYKGK